MQTLPDVSIPATTNQPMPRQALGEWLGIDVPTRYTHEAHEFFNLLMAGDSLITPLLFGMSSRTVWVCRGLAALLFFTRKQNDSITMVQALQIEAATGLALIILASQGAFSRRWWENGYFLFGGVLMIANALMTEID